ncbi:MAG: amino acid-binding protein [Bacteroidaceae bacterium]|jgi:hypothetical protein|nr:amino acid-binding protein [Bacteroidaceae bacterium]
MTVQQLSIFIENKSGTLLKVLEVLEEAKIQIIASTISDTVDYGIYRVICSDPSRAYLLLKEAGISITLTDVFAVELENKPGQAACAMKIFAQAGISINYMYSFLVHGKGILIFRTSDTEKSREVIVLNKMTSITNDILNSLAEE